MRPPAGRAMAGGVAAGRAGSPQSREHRRRKPAPKRRAAGNIRARRAVKMSSPPHDADANPRRNHMANEDQAEGKAKDIGGKVKEEVGDATGNEDMKREGQVDQAEGKVQKGIGDAKDELSDDS